MKPGMLQRKRIFLTAIGIIRRIAILVQPSATGSFQQTLSARAFWDGEEVIPPIVLDLARGVCECNWL